MRRALAGLLPDIASRRAYRVIVDGDTLPDFLNMGFRTVECLVKADDLVPAVSAVSAASAALVIAKVFRDQHMVDLGAAFPGYGLETNSGYGSVLRLTDSKSLAFSLCYRDRA